MTDDSRTPKEWFDQIIFMDLAIREHDTVFSGIFGDPVEPPILRSLEPLHLIHKNFGLIGPAAPTEIFCPDRPSILQLPEIERTGLIPEEALGRYFSHLRRIEIYPRGIALAANRLGLSSEHLESLVRVHEYCHAVVHLGVENWELEDCCSPPQNMVVEPGDWNEFVRIRTDNYNQHFGSDFHELLAQMMTWVVVSEDPNLSQAFLKLMDHQSRRYHLSHSLRSNVTLQKSRAVIGLLVRRRRDDWSSQKELAHQLRAGLEDPESLRDL